MSLTFTAARDELLTLFQTAWDANSGGVKLYYWDLTDTPPTADEWARVTVRHTGGNDAALGGRIFERTGFATVQIFTIHGRGLSRADELAKVAVDAFQGQSTPGGIWFRNVRLVEVGQDGKWFQNNVVADFEYTERT
ncbi:gp77 [Alphaproteobacteria phage PhiJL001]|uniref:Gp77 n=1 Tax=Alphaproteobacteria phage PhiJL001 TaxID=2681607 RepID=Q5DN28_9CAUD|nr:gp77 [Alphaproteobacteria phage PhiJL001]AAT69471.1 gp77 [Alphaproteobacteria phage PhiJL001]